MAPKDYVEHGGIMMLQDEDEEECEIQDSTTAPKAKVPQPEVESHDGILGKRKNMEKTPTTETGDGTDQVVIGDEM